MKENQKFNSYNQIIKEFDVYIMQVGNSYQFKLVKRLDGNKPPRLTLEKLAQMMQDGFDKISQRIDKIDQRIDKIDQRIDRLDKKLTSRIDNLIKKNNLIE